MRSPVRIWVAAPEKPRPLGRGFWFFWGCYPIRTAVPLHRNGVRFAYPDRRSKSLLFRRREWIYSLERIPGYSLNLNRCLVLQKTPDRKIGGFGFSGAAIRFELGSVALATESSAHIPTEDRQTCLSGEGSGYIRFCEYLGSCYPLHNIYSPFPLMVALIKREQTPHPSYSLKLVRHLLPLEKAFSQAVVGASPYRTLLSFATTGGPCNPLRLASQSTSPKVRGSSRAIRESPLHPCALPHIFYSLLLYQLLILLTQKQRRTFITSPSFYIRLFSQARIRGW